MRNIPLDRASAQAAIAEALIARVSDGDRLAALSSEERLATLVTRDAMVGTAVALEPAGVA